MKKIIYLFLILSVGCLFCTAQSSTLTLSCQGSVNFSRENYRLEEILLLREEMESLIRDGSIPIVIENEKDVVWLYLNDTISPRDYPESNFESEYFEIITDLFPLKITKSLKKVLKKSNSEFLKSLGIEYVVEDKTVISRIDYSKFERYVF